jgi:hypothetical protein
MYEEVHMDEYDEKIAYYLEIGVVQLEGVDEYGEIIYSVSDTAKELAPELWQSHVEYIDNALIDLYESGLITIDYDENLEANIGLSEEGYEKARSLGLIELDTDKDIPNN